MPYEDDDYKRYLLEKYGDDPRSVLQTRAPVMEPTEAHPAVGPAVEKYKALGAAMPAWSSPRLPPEFKGEAPAPVSNAPAPDDIPPLVPPMPQAPEDEVEVAQSPSLLDAALPPNRAVASPKDYRPELAEARNKEVMSNFISQVGRAGEQVGSSMVGAKGNYGIYDDIAKGAGNPSKWVKEDMEVDQKMFDEARERDAMDPASPRNRQAQQAFRKSAPALAQSLGDDLNNMTEEELAKHFGFVSEARKQENAMAQQKQLQANWQKDFDERVRHNMAEEKRPRWNPMMGTGQDPIIELRRMNRMKELGAKTDPFMDFYTNLSKIEKLAPGLIGGKVPENFLLGDVDRAAVEYGGGLGERYVAWKNPQILELSKAVKDLRDVITRDRTGAVINLSEQPFYEKLLEGSVASGPEAMATALKRVGEQVYHRMQNAQSGYGAPGNLEVLSEWKTLGDGNATYDSPLFDYYRPKGQGPGQTQQVAGAVVEPDGAPQEMAPEAETIINGKRAVKVGGEWLIEE